MIKYSTFNDTSIKLSGKKIKKIFILKTIPKKYEDIINLQGVGPYTAAAISSFAFKLPYAAVDGNVIRFIGRFFGEEAPYDTYQGRKIYQNLANKILDKDNSAEHNQAIIEFGALQCTFRSPNCLECPFSFNCVALELSLL